MTRSTVTPDTTPGARAGTARTALRATAALATLVVLYQGVTAGQILSRSEAAEEWHGGGAIALHVVTGLLTLAAVWYARETRGPWWPAVVSGVVFVASFVEASYGHGNTLYVHVPLAVVLTVGTVWVTAWAFAGSRRTAARGR